MPRPPKIGLDYFNVDVEFYKDTKIMKLLMKEGYLGVIVYLVALCVIYQNGYCLEMDLTDLADIVSTHLLIHDEETRNKVLKCLEAMVEINLFDNLSYEFEKVITSHGIQWFFYGATLRRKKSDKPHWLLSENEMENITRYIKGKGLNMSTETELLQPETIVNVDTNPVIVDKPLKNKVKVKEKVKGDIDDKYDKRNCPFHLDYFTSCLINDHLIDVYNIDIHRFIKLFQELQEDNDFALIERCFRYTRDYCRKHRSEIYDLFAFFDHALRENIRKMDGYDERMEKYYEELDAYLRTIRDDSEDE